MMGDLGPSRRTVCFWGGVNSMGDVGSGERADDRERVGVQGVDRNAVGEAMSDTNADPGDSAGEARRPVPRRTPLEHAAQEVAEHFC